MNLTRRVCLGGLSIVIASGVFGCSLIGQGSAAGSRENASLPTPERSYIWTAESIALSRELVASGDQETTRARDAIISRADAMLEAEIIPVTSGKSAGGVMAPSGNPRDYVSIGPYWWPNPDTDDGLPYVRRDGDVNPARSKFDADKLSHFGNAVRELALGYLVTGDERYAERAAEHLRTWFVDEETRMNPHMSYAQFVPGIADGRKSGIIETLRIRYVADSVEIIAESEHWSESDDREARRWYAEYLDWLLTSDLGTAERAAKNNHGTWATAQCAQYAMFVGNEDTARDMVRHGFTMLDSHIEGDGTQPEEFTRTIALHYCGFNLRGFLDLATYGQSLGIDLLNYENPKGGSIRVALDFAIPYMTLKEEWPYQQIKPNRMEMYTQLFRIASSRFDDAAYGAVVNDLPELDEGDLWMAYVWPRPLDARGE